MRKTVLGGGIGLFVIGGIIGGLIGFYAFENTPEEEVLDQEDYDGQGLKLIYMCSISCVVQISRPTQPSPAYYEPKSGRPGPREKYNFLKVFIIYIIMIIDVKNLTRYEAVKRGLAD